jgi:hypothetical protein
MRSEADEYTLSTPHERALAQALGLAGPDGGLPWGAHLAAQDGIDTGDLSWGLLTPAHWHVSIDHVAMLDPQALALEEGESRNSSKRCGRCSVRMDAVQTPTAGTLRTKPRRPGHRLGSTA